MMRAPVKIRARVIRLLISFALVPAAPATIICILVAIEYLAGTPGINFAGIPRFGVLFRLAYLIAGAHVLVLGIPAFLIGLRF
jgi:hypothetical protein